MNLNQPAYVLAIVGDFNYKIRSTFVKIHTT